jgi:hypothetical protein
MRPSLRVLPLALVVCAGLACGESRQEKLAREASYANAGKKDDVSAPTPEIPADPTREALRPLLTEIYGNKERLPDVVAADLSNEDGLPYQVTAGVLSVVRVKKGLSNEDKVKAIILGTAEADSWTFRKNARRDYADLIQKIKYSYGDDTKEKLLRIYADLKLVAFFNSPESAKADVDGPAGRASRPPSRRCGPSTSSSKRQVLAEWMARQALRASHGRRRRAVPRGAAPASRSELGQGGAARASASGGRHRPRQFKEWVAEIASRREAHLIVLTSMKDAQGPRGEFLGETHTIWAIQGSNRDPGEGQERSSDRQGQRLRRASARTSAAATTTSRSCSARSSAARRAQAGLPALDACYSQLLTDYQMLVDRGRRLRGQARCRRRDRPHHRDRPRQVRPALRPLRRDRGPRHHAHRLLQQGLQAARRAWPRTCNPDAALGIAHKCIIEGARGDVRTSRPRTTTRTPRAPRPPAASRSTRCSRASRSSTSADRGGSRATSGPPRTTRSTSRRSCSSSSRRRPRRRRRKKSSPGSDRPARRRHDQHEHDRRSCPPRHGRRRGAGGAAEVQRRRAGGAGPPGQRRVLGQGRADLARRVV